MNQKNISLELVSNLINKDSSNKTKSFNDNWYDNKKDLRLPTSEEVSPLQSLYKKLETCLDKQKKLHFVTKEISDIIKKS